MTNTLQNQAMFTEQTDDDSQDFTADFKTPFFYALPYVDNLRKIILAWKDHGREDCDIIIYSLMYALGKQVSAHLTNAEGLSNEEITTITVIPAPSSRSAIKRRGRMQTELLAKALAQSIGCKYHKLLHQKNIKKQANYTANERAGNKSGAIKLKGSLLHFLRKRQPASSAKSNSPNSLVILVDDICTTGATIIENLKVLRAAGYTTVAACALAKTQR
jgi:predicted amidophosphoribosyltransferase